jgi:hypothetical protein
MRERHVIHAAHLADRVHRQLRHAHVDGAAALGVGGGVEMGWGQGGVGRGRFRGRPAIMRTVHTWCISPG